MTGRKLATSPATLMPVRPAAAVAARCRARERRAKRVGHRAGGDAADRSDASSRPSARCSRARRRSPRAETPRDLRRSAGPRLPGAAGGGGIVTPKNATSSCAVRPLHVRMKSGPTSGRAPRWRRVGRRRWQPAQFARYDARPAAACASVNGPACACAAPASAATANASDTAYVERRSWQQPAPEVAVGRVSLWICR